VTHTSVKSVNYMSCFEKMEVLWSSSLYWILISTGIKPVSS